MPNLEKVSESITNSNFVKISNDLFTYINLVPCNLSNNKEKNIRTIQYMANDSDGLRFIVITLESIELVVKYDSPIFHTLLNNSNGERNANGFKFPYHEFHEIVDIINDHALCLDRFLQSNVIDDK